MNYGMKIGIGILASLILISVDCLLIFCTNMSMVVFWMIFAVAISVMLLPLLFIKEASIAVESDSLSISAPFVNERIPYSSIQAVEFRDEFHPGMRTFGMFMIRKGSGHFTNDEFGHYLFTGSTAIPGYIVVRYNGDRTLVFNSVDKDTTFALYNSLLSMSKADDDISALPGIEEKMKRDRRINRIVIFSVVALIAIILAVAIGVVCFAGHVDATLNQDDLHVSALFVDEHIQYTDISSVELRENFDRGERKSGFNGMGYESGRYNNAEFGNYLLAVHKDVNRTIVVTYGSGQHIAFNLDSNEETSSFYNELSTRI